MDGIYLTKQEKCFLFYLRFVRKIQPGFDVSHLVQCGLIRRNTTGKRNAIGEHIPDNTYSLTDFAVRYRIAKWQDRWHRIFTPILVSVVSSIITAIVTVLLME